MRSSRENSHEEIQLSLLPILGRMDDDAQPLLLADIFDVLLAEPSPVRFTAYDGSATGPADAAITIALNTPRAAAYMATAPGSLGMARATSPVTFRSPAFIRAILTLC